MKQTAIGVEQSNAITINNNFVGHVQPREFDAAQEASSGGTILDKVGGILIGSLGYPKQNQGIRVTNNIVAGTEYAGYTVMAHNCGAGRPSTFFGNVAHSIDGNKEGTGALVYPDPSIPDHGNCYEASNFAAYKCSETGIYTLFRSHHVIFKEMTMIDIGGGSGCGLA